ncbi:MAG: hypothetical protein EBR54_01730 [Flavobacteriia bacterium]|nr:hypothetical protein [Flavobacteriia bacterium]
MKLPLLLVGLFAFFLANAQDTIVDKNGAVTGVKIFEIDSLFISYYGIDTISKEVIVAPKSNFLVIKQGGNVISSYVPDTLINKSGKIIICKVLSIEPNVLTYFKYTDHILPLQVLSKDNLLLIKLSDGTFETPNAANANIPNAFQMGQDDAKTYYKTPGALVFGEFLLGGAHLFTAPIIAGTIIAYTPPKKLENIENPNNSLLSSNPSYKEGYLTTAKKKKRNAATAGFLSGFAAFWGVIIIGLTYFW